MLCVRNLAGRELVTSTEAEVASLADAHGSVIKGIEQLLSPLVGQPCFRLKLLSGDGVMNEDAALKLPLELQVAVCDYVESDTGDVDRLSDASQANDAAAVEALLRRPQNPDLVDSRGRTALVAAASSGALESLKLLVSAWADLNKPCTRTGATAVFAAAMNGYLDGATPVFVASMSGHLDLVRLLIESGADKDKANNYGATPVWIAAYHGHLHVVRLLMEMGADKDKPTWDGTTPLLVASVSGHLEVVRWLIEKGADIDRAGETGVTPILGATESCYLEVVRLLIEKGADKDRASKRGLTPLFLASQNGCLDIASLLIEKGADKNKAINKGATPLAIARGNGHLDVVSLLIEKGADEDDGATLWRGSFVM
ncbi:Ank2 [Symbiodinium sp. CCMP2592]|nr:Ank2 [Symbiodinium sp. CCMP2592]